MCSKACSVTPFVIAFSHTDASGLRVCTVSFCVIFFQALVSHSDGPSTAPQHENCKTTKHEAIEEFTLQDMEHLLLVYMKGAPKTTLQKHV